MNFKEIFNSYEAYSKQLEKTSPKNFIRFTKWLTQYIRLKLNEKRFNATYLPRYQEGQIIFVDFGCGIGHEFSYPHYAVVLDVNDRKKNQLLTVVPLTSKKAKHNILKPWEHELKRNIPALLGDKALANFDLNKPEYADLKKDLVGLALQSLPVNEFEKKYNSLLFQGVKAICDNNKDIMALREKMKEGSIVETNQIRTISKSRILFPTKKAHPMYDIKISINDLYAIKYKIAKSILANNIDTTNREHV